MRNFIIKENDANQRLDKFLNKAVPLLPKNLLYKYIRLKRIKVNSKKSELSYRLNVGDNVELYINDEFFVENDNHSFLNVSDNINIVYEDDNILLVNKPQGLVVHEDNDNTVDTLINRVLSYLYKRKFYDPQNENSFTPALCNRIDRNTCGIVIVAKTATALRVLNEKIKDREVIKKYLCVTIGIPKNKSATLTHYLVKDASQNKVRIYDKPNKDTKTIITKYDVIKTKQNLSLLEVDLKTGRTHQIRAHLAYIGTPILGDGKYGVNVENKKYGLKHQALCSYKLKFNFSDKNELSYLNHREFIVENVWFVDKFFN